MTVEPPDRSDVEGGDVRGARKLTKVSTHQSRTRSFNAWAGTTESLLRIYDEANASLDRARGVLDQLEGKPDWRLAEATAAMSMSAKVMGQGNLERSGALSEVLASMDVREVETISLDNRSSYFSWLPRIQIDFGGKWIDGLSIKVEGADPDWVSATYERLCRLCLRDVPRWGFVFREWFGVLVGTVAFLGVRWAFNLFLPTFQIDRLASLEGLLLVGCWAAWRFGVLQKFFRRIEVLQVGQRSSGVRAGVFLLTAIGLVSGLLAIAQAMIR